jgi:signal transduction histidine kinase
MKKFAVPLISCASLIVLFVLTTILVSVRFTHQIYGPLVSIHRYLDEVLAGSVPQPIQLRESDQLKDLADKLNSVAERMAVDQRAGTMVAVYRFLDELGEGKKPQPIKLRDNDRMTELVEKLNKIAGKIS